MSAIDRLRDGYTAGASDPSAAHDEFDRLARAVGLDSDHAAAIERERIAAWHEAAARECANAAKAYPSHMNMYTAMREAQAVHEGSARKIRNGEHWKEAR